MLCLNQEVLAHDKSNAERSEVIIDLRSVGLGLVHVFPIDTGKKKDGGKTARIGYTAEREVKIHRRQVFDAIEAKQ